MSKRLIIHAGWEKTGSTALQMFWHHSDAEQSRVIYPKLLRNGHPHHYNLYEECVAGRARDMVVAIDAELKEANGTQCLISCELFSRQNLKSKDVLADLCREAKAAGFLVTVLAVIRDPLAYLQALYAEAVKWGEAREFAEYAKGFVTKLDVSGWLYPSMEFIDRAVLLRYSDELSADVDTLLAGGIRSGKAATPDQRANARFPDYITEMMALFNRATKDQALTRELVGLIDTNRKIFKPGAATATRSIDVATAARLQQMLVRDRILNLLFVQGKKCVDYQIGSRRFCTAHNWIGLDPLVR